jgi:hypothetical protein
MAAWESLSGFVAGVDGGGGGFDVHGIERRLPVRVERLDDCRSVKVRRGDLFFAKGFAAATSLVKQIDELLLSGSRVAPNGCRRC